MIRALVFLFLISKHLVVIPQNCHCVLDVGLTSVERLHRHQVYPIVLLIKFKSPKQIREVKDSRFPLDKVGAKAAKEMYEHALKIEVEYKHFISGNVHLAITSQSLILEISLFLQNLKLQKPLFTAAMIFWHPFLTILHNRMKVIL